MMSMQQLVQIMAQLRDPQHGCPWDREQTFSSIVPYTIEEAYEVADSIAEGDMQGLCDELGDLLFQVVFYSQMAREQGLFDIHDVTRGVCEKMIRRHPHVFADEQIANADEQSEAWERLKAKERGDQSESIGHLQGIARALPALMRAEKLQKRAAKVGFDWPHAAAVVGKVREELLELEQAIENTAQADGRIKEEMGDLLFSCVNLLRHLGLDAEATLRQANDKFERRFHSMERFLAEQGQGLRDVGLDEMDAAWDRVKQSEKG